MASKENIVVIVGTKFVGWQRLPTNLVPLRWTLSESVFLLMPYILR